MQKQCTNCEKIALELSENSTKIGRKSIKAVQKQDGNTIKMNTKPSRITLNKQDLPPHRPRLGFSFITANSAKWGRMLEVNIYKYLERKKAKACINGEKKVITKSNNTGSAMSAWNPGVEHMFWTSEFKDCLPKF